MTTLKTMVTDWIRVKAQSSHPATPATGFGNYYDYGGAPYFINAAGTQISLTPGASDTSGWVAGTGTWSYSSADAPTFVITTSTDLTGVVGVGMRIKLTQTTVKYFIVTAISASAITVYGGTDYTLISAAITGPMFSTHKAPLGFPISPAKWTVELSDTTFVDQANPTQNTWYNLGSLTISAPIGVWNIYQSFAVYAEKASNPCNAQSTLSTANNSESDASFSAFVAGYSAATLSIFKQNVLTLATKTALYVNCRTTSAGHTDIAFNSGVQTLSVKLVCAYL